MARAKASKKASKKIAAKGRRKGKVSAAETQRRLRDAEKYMVQYPSAQIRHAMLCEKYDVVERTVESWESKVRQKWRSQATPERIEESRNEIRELLRNILHQTMNRKREVVADDGTRTLVLDPDFRHTLQSINQLRTLDALDIQPVQKVDLSGDIGLGLAVTEQDRAGLLRLIKNEKKSERSQKLTDQVA